MTYLRKHAKRLGLPPGALVATEEEPIHIKLSYIEYDEFKLIEKEDSTIEECLKEIKTPTMTWIQVYGVSNPSIIATIGERFKLHPLVLEDILNTAQRPKLDVYDNQIFIIARFLKKSTNGVEDQQVSFAFGNNYLISFLQGDEDLFKAVKERLRKGDTRLRKQGSDYLAYALIDMIVDHYFVVLEDIDVRLDKLEADVSNAPLRTTIRKIQHAKREMIFLRKSIWPMRDLVNQFQHLEPPLVSSMTRLYLADVYDNLIQVIDVVEGFRDVIGGLFDIYLSNINIRTNDIIKFLTVVSTIFVPLTFISSVYGMNFDYMPELRTAWGYYFALGIMGTVALTMLFFFRRKKWI